MLAAIVKALGQLGDSRTRRVLRWNLLATAALFAVLLAGVWFVLLETRLFEIGPIETVTDLLGGLAAVVLALVLFPGVAGLTLSLFLEEIAGSVEARHYPELPPPRAQPLLEVAWVTVRFAAVTVLLNLLALPVYAILFFLPPLNLFVFYGLNGYLLGREYYELVALRRMNAETAQGLRRVHAGRLLVAGAVITFFSSLPLVNLLAPVVATAFMVHLFEDMRSRAGQPGVRDAT
ncbi:MAG: EI24 domain-containing protein [Alphaproteobacteria bacterium]